MDTQIEILNQFLAATTKSPAPLRREAEMVVHKLTYPMKEILAKVPGDSLTERAKKLKVSRQTMYVWMSEKFRPTLVQAKRIAKFTDVPVEHIVDDGFDNEAARKATRRQAANLAKRREKAASGQGRTTPRRRRSASDRHRVGEA